MALLYTEGHIRTEISTRENRKHFICVPGPMDMLWNALRSTLSNDVNLTTIRYPDDLKTGSDAVDYVVSACQRILLDHPTYRQDLVLIGYCHGCLIAHQALLKLQEVSGSLPPIKLILVSPDLSDCQFTQVQCALSFSLYCAAASSHFTEAIIRTLKMFGFPDIDINVSKDLIENHLISNQKRFESLFTSSAPSSWVRIFRTASGFWNDHQDQELKKLFHRYCRLMKILSEIHVQPTPLSPPIIDVSEGIVILPRCPEDAKIQKVRGVYPTFEIRIANQFHHWELPDHFLELAPDICK